MHLLLTILVSVTTMLAGGYVYATSTSPAHANRVAASLHSDVMSVRPGETVTLALDQQIEEGWHTYWLNPGDSGEPTSIEWELPDGVETSEIIWPTPQRIPYFDLVNYGYKNQAALLTELTVPADWPAGKPIDVRADAFWLVCEEICIPEEASYSLAIQTTSGPTTLDPDLKSFFASARQKTPADNPWPTAIVASNSGYTVKLDGKFDTGTIADAYFFPTDQGATIHAAPQEIDATASSLTIELQKGELPPTETLNGLFVLTENVGGDDLTRAFNVSAPIDAAGLASQAGLMSIGILQAMLLALLGGIILNLMPCVFPILSLKALGLIQQAPRDLREARLHGLSFGAGIVVTFLALAVILIALRAGGAQIGWGFQLQSPLIMSLLAYLLLAIGLNLSGVFEFGSSFAGIGGRFASQSGHAGSFSTGVLAVIVATPCTAPFMSTALGFAMFQPPPITLAVFLALAAGFALPYLSLSFMPALGRLLPKPGAWMVLLRQFLAFPIYATVAWIVWVLSQQLESSGLLAVMFGGVLVAMAAWLFGILGHVSARTSRLATGGLAVLALIGASLLIPTDGPLANSTAEATASETRSYESFTTERLGELRNEGRPVFINLTAAWCITCEVNDRVVLEREAVVDAMEVNDIAYLKGDWTNQDPDITSLLAEFGRNGVPLYLIYPKGTGDARVLAQIVSVSLVLEAFNGVSSV